MAIGRQIGSTQVQREGAAYRWVRSVGLELLKVLSVVGVVLALLWLLWSWLTLGAPETPGNAAIDFGVSWQVGEPSGAASRVCEAWREEFLDEHSTFHDDLRSSLGSALGGLAGRDARKRGGPRIPQHPLGFSRARRVRDATQEVVA